MPRGDGMGPPTDGGRGGGRMRGPPGNPATSGLAQNAE